MCLPLASYSPVLRTLLFPRQQSAAFLLTCVVSSSIQDVFLNFLIEKVARRDLLSALSGGVTLRARVVEVLSLASVPLYIFKAGFFLQYEKVGNFADDRVQEEG